MAMAVFDTLVSLNVNDHTETKRTGSADLTYLSWPWAWAEVKKRYPEASYTIVMDPVTHLPYSYDPATGYMVYTTVTIEGVTHMMWLPVMDSSNKAMKAEPYTIKTKYKEIRVEAATMFDVNKTIMRCLVKNLAMFGLGLYIYAGEDVPEGEEEAPKNTKKQEQTFKCSRCGATIEPYYNGDGVEISPAKHAAGSKVKFGKVFCLDCIQEYINGGNKNA